jgi:hypothetical protein
MAMEENARRRIIGNGEHPGASQNRDGQETHGLEHANLLIEETYSLTLVSEVAKRTPFRH